MGEQRLRFNISGKSTTANSVAATFQLADIAKPLLSVSRLIGNCCDVKFTSKGSTITTSSGMRVLFRRNGGVYVLTADVEPWTNSSVVSAVTTPNPVTPRVRGLESKSPGSDVTRRATSFRRQG